MKESNIYSRLLVSFDRKYNIFFPLQTFLPSLVLLTRSKLLAVCVALPNGALLLLLLPDQRSEQ